MKSNHVTKTQIEAQAVRKAILEAVLAADKCVGLSISALMKMTGRSNSNVGYHLRALAAAGLIECSNYGGSNCVWGPIGIWAHFSAPREAREKARARQSARRGVIRKLSEAKRTARPVISIWDAADRCSA